MKYFHLFLFFIVVSCSTIDNRAPNNPPKSLIRNSSFEGTWSVKKDPKGWQATRLFETKKFVIFNWELLEKHSGSKSVSIEIKDDHPQKRIDYNWTQTLSSISAGEKFKINGWIKTKRLSKSAWIIVQFWDSANIQLLELVSTQQKYNISGTNDWRRVELIFDVPLNCDEVIIRAGISAPYNNGGKVWFDDIEIEKI